MIETVTVRRFATADLEVVWSLNQASVPEVGEVSRDQLTAIIDQGAAWVATDRDDVVGMIVALATDAAYASPNFRWFVDRGGSFLYVDRIATGERARGLGVGRRLYRAAAFEAVARDLATVVCEVNTLPPNPVSRAFHTRLGFAAVGEAHYTADKAVVFLEANARDLAL